MRQNRPQLEVSPGCNASGTVQVRARARRQEPGAGDDGAADRADVPRAGPAQEHHGQTQLQHGRLLLNRTYDA